MVGRPHRTANVRHYLRVFGELVKVDVLSLYGYYMNHRLCVVYWSSGSGLVCSVEIVAAMHGVCLPAVRDVGYAGVVGRPKTPGGAALAQGCGAVDWTKLDQTCQIPL